MPEVFGLEVADLPEGHHAVRVLVVIETVDMADAGDVRKLSVRSSDGVTMWDVIGMAGAAKIEAEAQWLNAPEVDDDDA